MNSYVEGVCVQATEAALRDPGARAAILEPLKETLGSLVLEKVEQYRNENKIHPV